MKAQKLIINWEEQDLSQVFSVNWQTGDVIIPITPWVSPVDWDVNEWHFVLQDGFELGDGVICVFSWPEWTPIVWNIYDTQWNVCFEIAQTMPALAKIDGGQGATWMIKNVFTWSSYEQMFFPWQGVTYDVQPDPGPIQY